MNAAKLLHKNPPIGRPLKYPSIIEELDDSTLYTSSLIVSNSTKTGTIYNYVKAESSEAELKQIYSKIRHALSRLSANHQFPVDGDGWVYILGQTPLRGWYGWRWKEAAHLALSTDLTSNESDSHFCDKRIQQ